MKITGFEFAVPETSRWTRSAACAEDGVAPMFPHEQDVKGIQYAKEICARCPVRALCLNEALERGESFGVWGGLDSSERRALKRRTARKGALTADESTALDAAATAAPADAMPVFKRPLVG